MNYQPNATNTSIIHVNGYSLKSGTKDGVSDGSYHIPLPNPAERPKSIRFNTAYIPISFYNVSDQWNAISWTESYLTTQATETTYTIYLTEGEYAVPDLLTAITTKMNTAGSTARTYTATLPESTGKLQITCKTNTAISEEPFVFKFNFSEEATTALMMMGYDVGDATDYILTGTETTVDDVVYWTTDPHIGDYVFSWRPIYQIVFHCNLVKTQTKDQESSDILYVINLKDEQFGDIRIVEYNELDYIPLELGGPVTDFIIYIRDQDGRIIDFNGHQFSATIEIESYPKNLASLRNAYFAN